MRWKMKSFSAQLVEKLSVELGVYRIVATILALRGATDPSSARRFLNPALEELWSNPEDIPGMIEVANGVENAMRTNKRMVIFGDYDVDGITASALMYNVLLSLGVRAQVVLPLRAGEGYGLTEEVLGRILSLDPEVVLTVDCGVTAVEEVSYLKARGIEVFVTDHHEVSDTISLPAPAANPKFDPDNPAVILSGVGVALKLAALLCHRFDKPELWKSQLDLAALGTLADCMLLSGENRAIVSAGIRAINTQPRPGISALLEVSGSATKSINAEALSYGLIPRLNAAGRVSDPLISFNLLCTLDPGRAMQLAQKLEGLNTERKEIEAALMSKAVRQIEALEPGRASLVVGGEDWHEGVRGIVASRLARQYGVPVVVFSFENELAVGSGRSVGTVNLYEAVSRLEDHCVRFGGHEAAIGATIKKKDIEEFSRRLEEAIKESPTETFELVDEIDCTLSFEHLSFDAIDELEILEPFGNGNPEPRLLTTGLMVRSPRYVGTGEKHLSFTLFDGTREFSAIWFNATCKSIDELPTIADVIYHVRIDSWRGRRKIKLHILDLFAAGAGSLNSERPALDKLKQLLLLGSNSDIYQEVAHCINGREVTLRRAQSKCLETLAQGTSTLAIMATGRGKSLIFYTFAATQALRKGKASLFIYPLRSLIGDQEYFLAHALKQLGLTCASLTGATPEAERQRIYQAVQQGSLSVVLTTPEFVLAHSHNSSLWSNFSFVAIDEAHHIATSSKSFRPDYTRLERLRTLIPGAVMLGLSATSDKPTTDDIVKSLGVEHIVIDTSKRPNLKLVDHRNADLRDEELVSIVAGSLRTLVYVSSRGATIELCKLLRKKLDGKAQRIAFYNAALETDDRRSVEEAFRQGKLDCLVATSAFGEGVNIADVRDVVLYDLPYSIIDFNQMAGRAGRDGLEAHVHILAKQEDTEQLLTYLEQQDDVHQSAEQAKAEHDERQMSARQLKLFSDWLFDASPHTLQAVIQKPLTPLEGLEE